MTHDCEICNKTHATVVRLCAMGQFVVCEKCNNIITYIIQNEYVDFDKLPKSTKDELETYCGGWDSANHRTEDKLTYLKPLKEDEITPENLMNFCRSCLLEYLNDDEVSKNLTNS